MLKLNISWCSFIGTESMVHPSNHATTPTQKNLSSFSEKKTSKHYFEEGDEYAYQAGNMERDDEMFLCTRPSKRHIMNCLIRQLMHAS